jgi:hypothetical protein
MFHFYELKELKKEKEDLGILAAEQQVVEL